MRFRPFSAMVVLFLAWPLAVRAADRASGFGPGATPAERELAEQPQPDGYFREMIGFWQGVPGLEALRARWEGFKEKDAGFAVLAALIPEAEGKPDAALEKLRGLPGSSARWNEGRLLALLGREQEAVAVLSALVTAAELPEMGASALIALTELDCTRGDFAKALQRTTAAWAARSEEGFRLRILERHLSLLVEAGREKAFLEEQVKAAETTGDESAARTAQRVMAVMADWFTEDARVESARAKLGASYGTGIVTMIEGGRPGGTLLRPTMECGILKPRGAELERLGQEASGSLETAAHLAVQLSLTRQWPENLDGLPLLKQTFAAHPLHLSWRLFYNPDPARPLPPLARKLANGMDAGVERRTLDLIERAWGGRAGPQDAETLAAIIVESPQLRRQRGTRPWSSRSVRLGGWPAVDHFPTEEVVWNLSGKAWADYYASACRLAPLLGRSYGPLIGAETSLVAWSQWRPEWPMMDNEAALTLWAWKQLEMMREATGERAATIAGRMSDPGDRFFFAARCRRKELLAEWCRDGDLLRQVNSTALMHAVQAFQDQTGQEAPEGSKPEALMAIAREMARRMDLNPLDLIRSMGSFHLWAPAAIKQEMLDRPVDVLLAQNLGWQQGDSAVNGHWRSQLIQTVPHPLFGLPVSPSVERFRVLAGRLRNVREDRMSTFRSPLLQVVQLLFGGDEFRAFEMENRAPALVRALEVFPTLHPLKRQIIRWDALLKTHDLSMESRMKQLGRQNGEQHANLAKALRVLAEEEQTSLSWHLVRAMLEENDARRALLLELVKARSPLTAGAGAAPHVNTPPAPALTTAPSVPVAPNWAMWGAKQGPGRTAAQGLAPQFLQMIKEPATRRQLEPAGALGDFVGKGGDHAFLRSLRGAGAMDFQETAQQLLDAVDPLAARMAVILINRQKRPLLTDAWLLRALAIFPDDPELLLAFASADVFKGHTNDPGRRPAFLRGLASLKEVHSWTRKSLDSRPDPEDAAWCGIPDRAPLQNAETARALAAFAERSRPASLPQGWVRAMESVLNIQAELEPLTEAEVRSIALSVVNFKTPWRAGQGDPPGWMHLLDGLDRMGKKGAAEAAAEGLLSQPRGSLGYPGDPTEPAPPWHNWSGSTVTGPEAEGWKWLERAARSDPGGLADRLQAVAAAHPTDEHTALAALLARGRIRALTADEVKMPGLREAGRHRVLAYASWLLPPDRLPEALVLESWEAEAQVEFSDVSNGDRNFKQGSAYLDRLETAGAVDAVRRVLPSFVGCLKKITAGGFDNIYPTPILHRLKRLGTQAQLEYFRTLMIGRLSSLPDGSSYKWIAGTYKWTAGTLRAELEEFTPVDLPAELVRRVTLALETGIANPHAGGDADNYLGEIAIAAAGDPRWHQLLRQFLARQQALQGNRPPAPALLTLTHFFDALDSDDLLPDLALDFSSTKPGKGVLHWKTRGPLLRKESGKENGRAGVAPDLAGPWAKLVAGLAGKCDTVVVVEDPASGAARVVARLERLPGDGVVPLENLPQIGRLRVQLYQREAPLATAELPPLGYNSLPVLIDTSRPPSAQTASPEGWQLLADPIPLGATTQWYIDNSDPDSKPWPKGIHLILLDDANHVCASTPFSEERRYTTLDTAAFHGLQLGLNHLAPTSPFSGPEARLRLAGPPRQMALAISLQQRYGTEAENRAAASLTLREWPAPSAPSGQGRLEILGFWQLIPDGENPTHPPALAEDSSLAAWFTPGKIFLLDLRKQDQPQEIALKLPHQTRLDTFFWESGRLVIGYILTDAAGSNSRYGFASVRPGDPVPVTLGNLPPDIRLFPSYHTGGVGIGPVFLDSQGHICGVLDPAGKFLPLPPAESGTTPRGPLSSYQQLSATTYLCRQGNDGLYPVLDWTDGTLRISSVAVPPAPLIKPRRPWRTDGEGTTGDLTANPRKRWGHPLAVNDFRPISEDLVVGLGTDGSLVLFRPIPAPKTAPPLLPDE